MTELSLTDLISRGCDLGELREMEESELTELLTALGFEESADQRATLKQKLDAAPSGLSSEDLAAWAAEEERGDSLASEMSAETLLSRAEALKAQGNADFKASELGKACSAYQEAVELLTSKKAAKALKEWWAVRQAHVQDSASPLLVSLYTNLAACHNKLQQWESGILAANKALEIEPTSVKARFRRGVAKSNLGHFEAARRDLKEVLRIQPNNLEARTVLEVVLAATKEQKSSERSMFGKAFSGPSLYAEEEARERRRREEAARRVEAEEQQIKTEWRQECARLREKSDATELLAQAAAAGDVEAIEALDKLAPMSLGTFKEARKKRKEAEAEAKRVEEEDARAKRRAQQSSSALEADEDDAELLKGLTKGYKKRADGSTTTFFDRQVDPTTKALLDAQKAPKRIERDADPSQSAVSTMTKSTKSSSAWNMAGTWEERDATEWVRAEVKSRLSVLRTEECSVIHISKLEGSASVISARGKTKHPFELLFDLVWEMPASADASESPSAGGRASGVLSYCDVSPSSKGSVTYELTERVTVVPATDDVARMHKGVAALKQLVNMTMQTFLTDFIEHF
eukprot:CAMPEP_0119320086 /NCGR_PEP_ID=MMETSP1333-20130426/51376_1 /TAXON_ID=418940 /ORGANISM="Scyphosphaera apsteinii, Strain RCC1455" /LENGTH=575 /DNA_ID=CAMNT_0007326697 /DNA_START=229 /DNA_END=1956 /DNA_ORIENTATION=+